MPVDLNLQLVFEVLGFECYASLQHSDVFVLLLDFEREFAVLGLKLLALEEIPVEKIE